MKKYIFKYTLSLLCALLFAQAALLAQVGGTTTVNDCPLGDNVPGHINPTPTLLNNAIPPPPEDPEFNPPPVNDRRGIYWVHGLGGNEDSWTEASTATMNGAPQFPARNAFCFVSPKYATTSLEGSASSLHQKILNAAMPGVDTSKHLNFIIAHSQGSLVGRQVDLYLNNLTPENEDLERRFHGMVTFGGPHLGAKIINNRDNGVMTQFVETTCKKVLTTEAINLIDNKGFLQALIGNKPIINGVSGLCNNVGDILPFIMGGVFEGTSDDYPVGGEKVAILNDFGHPDLHKAAFAGVEYKLDAGDEPANPKQLMWRMLTTFVFDDKGNNGPAFSRNEDDSLVNVANRLAQKYLSIQLEKQEEIDELKSWFPFLPCEGFDWVFFFGPCTALDGHFRKLEEERNINRDAYEWLDKADMGWKIIIGALEVEVTEETGCECTWTDNTVLEGWSYTTFEAASSPEQCANIQSGNPNETVSCNFVTRSYPSLVFKPSDGVVTLESASGFPGVSITNRVEETNHFQLRNSVGTRDALLLLYRGQAGDEWFKVD